MRLYKPTYPTRYTPDPRPSRLHGPGKDQTSWVDPTHPFASDGTPPVIPLARRLKRLPGSARGWIADSRVSGDCRRRWFDTEGGHGLTRHDVYPARTPYQTADVSPEGALAIMLETGTHLTRNSPAYLCGCRRADLKPDHPTWLALRKAGCA